MQALIHGKIASMKFGIVVSDTEKARKLAKKIEKFLEGDGHEVLSGKLDGSEVVLTLGGDGTLLHESCDHIEANIPFVGINVGKLGFLTACEADEWQDAVKKLVDGDYFVSERMTLETRMGKSENSYRAVNEIVVKGMYRVVDLEIHVNSQKFLEASGDGVIVSTQTGSTAYSLSAGGPIVDPDLDCLVVTPVNAHGLPVPSVVLSPNDSVEIKIVEGDDVSLVIDGQEHVKVTKGRSIKVSKGKCRVKFGYFDKHHFLKSLNAKFGLSGRLAK